MSKKLRVVERKSPLSLLQVKKILLKFTSLQYELISLDSYGDKNKSISLIDSSIPEDFFTRELDNALFEDRADVAIHSAKDLPYPLPQGLELYSLTEAKDKSDALVSKGNITLDNLPEGARVGTSSLNRKNELLKIRPDLTVVSIRGTIEERIAQVDNGYVDALIVATCELQRLGLDSRIVEILPFKVHPLQGNLAIVGKTNNSKLKELFTPLDIRVNYGKITLVGFGPGNSDLLTIGGDKALLDADIIFHDDLVDVTFLDKYNAEKFYVGKRKNNHSYHQEDINELLYQAAIKGQKVVRLKGGDPMIFAHGREEIDFLQSRFVEVSVIPGFSSGIALAAYTHIPLRHRGISSSVAFVTGHGGDDAPIPNADTFVYYMAGAKISEIAKKLIASGTNVDTPVALVHNVSLLNQKTFFSTLRELQFSIIKYPTPILIVVGDVVGFESKKVQRNVLLTATNKADYKGQDEVVHTPLITIDKIKSSSLDHLLKSGIESYDWIIFTSRNGVRFFFEALDRLDIDIRSLAYAKIVSVGNVTTSELRKYRIQPDIESPTESAEGIVNYFKENKIENQKILLPRSNRGLKYLSDELLLLKNDVTDLPIYQNQVNDQAQKVNLSEFQKVIFSSPSAVEAFNHLYGDLPSGIQLIARGETTECKIKESLN